MEEWHEDLRGLFAAVAAIAGTEPHVSSGWAAKGPGLAVHGYDVVAYLTRSQATLGRAKRSTVSENATVRPAREMHLDSFEGDSGKYPP